MNWFSNAKPEQVGPSDLQVIRGKLLDCEAQIGTAERELAQVSIAAALSDDSAAGNDIVARLVELRSRKELLTAALKQAEQAERENLGRLNAREFEARKRSLSQHLGRLQRDASDVVALLVAQRDAYRRMVESGQSALRVLPSAMLDQGTAWESLLSAKQLRRNCEIEAWRLAKDGPAFPGCSVNRPLYAGELPPLEQTIRELASNLRTSLEKCGPAIPNAAATPEPVRAEGERVEPASTPMQAPPEPERTVLPVIDLRGTDLGVPKKPTEQAEEMTNAA